MLFFPLKQNVNRSLWRELKMVFLIILAGFHDIEMIEYSEISNLLQVEKRNPDKRCYQMTLQHYFL